MLVKATKVLAKTLNRRRPAGIAAVTLEKVRPEFFGRSYMWTAEEYGDYDIDTGMVKTIMVTYPREYYAVPQYLGTKDLHRIYYDAKPHNLDEFVARFFEAVEI